MRIDTQVATGEAAYTRANEDSIFDAMPGFWKSMQIEERQHVIQRINRLKEEEGEQMWLNKTHLLSLSELVPLEHVPKLRICHQVVKEHPDVIVGTRRATVLVDGDNSDDAETHNDRSDTLIDLTLENRNEGTTTAQGLNSFMLLPPSLLKEIKEAKTNVETVSAQEKLFKHVVKFRNRMNYDKTKISVSDHLNVEVSEDQQRLLNPTVLDTVAGFLLKDAQGDGAKKRLPQRRLNFVDGQVSAHCSILNSDDRLKLINLSNEVAAVMADIQNDRSQEREKTRARKEQEEAEKEQRRIARLQKEKEAEEKGVDL